MLALQDSKLIFSGQFAVGRKNRDVSRMYRGSPNRAPVRASCHLVTLHPKLGSGSLVSGSYKFANKGAGAQCRLLKACGGKVTKKGANASGAVLGIAYSLEATTLCLAARDRGLCDFY